MANVEEISQQIKNNIIIHTVCNVPFYQKLILEITIAAQVCFIDFIQ